MTPQQAEAAVRRYKRLQTVKRTLAVPWLLACLAGVYAVYVAGGLIWAGAALIIGIPVATVAVTPLLVLPLGYILCGRDAMRLAAETQRH